MQWDASGCQGEGAAAPPLKGVERLGDATGDGHDEAGDEDDPVEDHVVLGAVTLLLLIRVGVGVEVGAGVGVGVGVGVWVGAGLGLGLWG